MQVRVGCLCVVYTATLQYSGLNLEVWQSAFCNCQTKIRQYFHKFKAIAMATPYRTTKFNIFAMAIWGRIAYLFYYCPCGMLCIVKYILTMCFST